MNRLTQSLSTLTTSHTNNTNALSALTEEELKLEAQEVELRKQVEAAEARRAWFQEFRENVESVAEFLDQKVRSPISLFPSYVRC